MSFSFDQLLGLHRGEHALVVGCGPSLRLIDCCVVKDWWGPVIGVNACFDLVWPDYWISVDRLGNQIAFFPNTDYGVGECPKYEFKWSSGPKLNVMEYSGLKMLGSGAMTAFTAAIYMGCNKISLIGVDFRQDTKGRNYYWQGPGERAPYMGHKCWQIVEYFKDLVQQAREQGVEVENLNPKSLVK